MIIIKSMEFTFLNKTRRSEGYSFHLLFTISLSLVAIERHGFAFSQGCVLRPLYSMSLCLTFI